MQGGSIVDDLADRMPLLLAARRGATREVVLQAEYTSNHPSAPLLPLSIPHPTSPTILHFSIYLIDGAHVKSDTIHSSSKR